MGIVKYDDVLMVFQNTNKIVLRDYYLLGVSTAMADECRKKMMAFFFKGEGGYSGLRELLKLWETIVASQLQTDHGQYQAKSVWIYTK